MTDGGQPRDERFVRDSVSWGPVFEHVLWSVLGDINQATILGSRYPWRIVVPYATPEWRSFARVLALGLRATAPPANASDVDELVVGPLQIVGDSGAMQVTRLAVVREGPDGRVVRRRQLSYSLQYFVRANCWQVAQSTPTTTR